VLVLLDPRRDRAAVGREDVNARIRVFAGDLLVRSYLDEGSQRWSAHLPPGDYRVAVDRKGRVTEDYVRVDRANVQRRLRP
jgi:hypothetical protein